MSGAKLKVVPTGNPVNTEEHVNKGQTPAVDPNIDWKAMNKRLADAGLKSAVAESTPDRTEEYETGKGEKKTRVHRPGQKEKFRVRRTDGQKPEILGYGYSPADAVSAAIFLYGNR